jgi:hypothetical protein
MRRRDFITLLSGTAAAWPLSAHTQQSTKRLIGVLSNPSGGSFEALFPAFHLGLSESGYVEGHRTSQLSIVSPTVRSTDCRHSPPT